MKSRSILYAFALTAMILVVGLACLSTAAPAQSTQPPQPVSDNSSSSTGSSDLVTFTDQNKYYQIDLPGDWKHDQTVDKENNYYYIDTFTSPDGNAIIENIAYDDGKPFTGGTNGKFALYLLNTFYSNTGKEGDIRVSDDSIQKDGSERLTWTSKGGGYSGFSYFEIRNKTTFLMFTVDWANDFESDYIDLLDNVISSYRLP
jgi:hypothetical protein